MKKLITILLTALLASSALAAEKHLSALFGYSVFYIPANNQPYVETYLDFRAWTLEFAKIDNDLYRATVEVAIVVRSGDSIVYLKKRDLMSPTTSSDTATNFTFMDLHRFSLPNGIYDLQLILHDKASGDQPFVHNDKLVVFFEKNKPAMSNIQLMSSATPTVEENMLSRNGYDMVPYFDDYVPAKVTHLHPYFEIYNLDKELAGQALTVNLHIEQLETHRRLPAFSHSVSRAKAGANTPIYTTLDIAKLPSGNYILVAEVCDPQGQVLLKRELTFMRSNPGVEFDDQVTEEEVAVSFVALLKDKEQLNFYIDALYPIASSQEIAISKEVMQDTSLAAKQTFFYYFWHRRNFIDPAGEWANYRRRLDYVTEHFTYPKTPGYRTDFGRVYLQYGPPDFVRDEKNFMAPFIRKGNYQKDLTPLNYSAGDDKSQGTIHYLPYQLWRYNQLPNDYSNRVFLFWDEFRSGYYKLLNSSARGEVRTAGWERDLSQKQLEEDVMGEVGEQFERGF